jgi:hypothetical protein
MNIDDEFRDLAPLDPRLDPRRWERMVGGVMQAAAPELSRRTAAPDPGLLLLIHGWTRPALSTAAALAAAAATVLMLRGPATPAATEEVLSTELGYPASVATWAETGDVPSVEELMLSLEGE